MKKLTQDEIKMLENDCELKVKQALELLLSADDCLCVLNNNCDNHDYQRISNYLFTAIQIIKNDVMGE